MKRTRIPMNSAFRTSLRCRGRWMGLGSRDRSGARRGVLICRFVHLGGASNTFFLRFLEGKVQFYKSAWAQTKRARKGTCNLEVGTQVVSNVEFISRHVLNYIFLELLSRFLN